MGVEARCRPCHSAAHCRHMKRQPFLHNGCPCRGCRYCNRHGHLHCHCQLRCRCRRRCPLPLPLPSAIAIAVAITIAAAISVSLPSAIAIAVALAVGHCRLHLRWPSQLPSPLALTVAIAVSRFQEFLPWHGKNCIQTIEAKNAYLILFCSDSGGRTDQRRMTDQVSSSDCQHQRWAASGKQ
jgi:hypothetical protein